MGRPVWRDVLEHIQLGPHERAAVLAAVKNERHRTDLLWGRIAAKEAARRLWLEAGSPSVYPADLTVAVNELGRTLLYSLANPEDPVAAVSIAHTEGVAIAIAAADPSTHLGIAVETIAEPQAGTLASAFTAGEERLLARVSAAVKAEWVARFRCAASAALKAIGTDGPAPNLRCEITQFDEPSGAIEVAFDPQVLEAPARSLLVGSARRGDHVWAWALLDQRRS